MNLRSYDNWKLDAPDDEDEKSPEEVRDDLADIANERERDREIDNEN